MEFLHLYYEVYPHCDDELKNRISYPYAVRITDIEERIAFEKMLERYGFDCVIQENGYQVVYVNFTLKRFGNAVKPVYSGCIGHIYEKAEFMDKAYIPYTTNPTARAILSNNYAQSAAIKLSGAANMIVTNSNVFNKSYMDYEKGEIEKAKKQINENDLTILTNASNFEIELKEGTDPSSYFFFYAMKHKGGDTSRIEDDDFTYSKDVFCIEESDIQCFLWFFFKKYFDPELVFNKNRVEVIEDGYPNHFEWYLTNNFFTYEVMEEMCKDILNTVDMLTHDYYNPELNGVKEEYSILFMTDRDDEDHQITSQDSVIKKHIYVVLDFYLRFVNRIRKMIDQNPNADMIATSGP